MTAGPKGNSGRSDDSQAAEDIAALVRAANQRTSLPSKLDRAANILRYYRTSQLLRRVVRVGFSLFPDRRIEALPEDEAFHVRAGAPERLRNLAASPNPYDATKVKRHYEEIAAGKFTLLNQTRHLGTPIDWHGSSTPHPSRLWSFQLHYHEYLRELVAEVADDNSEHVQTAWHIVADWIEANPPHSSSIFGNAWHPYCISRRLPVWAELFATCPPAAELHEIVLRSLATQAETLSNHLEFDLGGNHLLENLRCLVFAATLLDGSRSERWLGHAEQQLRRQLPIQVLPHGEHFERAPMYHCQVLRNLLQIMHLAPAARASLDDVCRPYAQKMYDFLQFLLHPDGEIPLFGDSCHGEAPSVKSINRLADVVNLERSTPATQPVTVSGRYWKWQHGRDSLIFDAGPAGSDELPAHAHCDLLGFEASIDGRRCFVDSGVFDYEDSAMRAYCRSSAAHNVVTVGLKNSCDVWSKFRMGRRARSRQFRVGQEQDFAWCLASHDGYRHLGIPRLSRLLLAHTNGALTCLEHASGRLSDPLVGRLHLAPEVIVRQDGPARVVLNVADSERWIFFAAGVMLELTKGWYCDQFGKRKETQVITYRPKLTSDICHPFGWCLSASKETVVTIKPSTTSSYQVEVVTDCFAEVFSAQFPN